MRTEEPEELKPHLQAAKNYESAARDAHAARLQTRGRRRIGTATNAASKGRPRSAGGLGRRVKPIHLGRHLDRHRRKLASLSEFEGWVFCQSPGRVAAACHYVYPGRPPPSPRPAAGSARPTKPASLVGALT